jgi:hypothetical protein
MPPMVWKALARFGPAFTTYSRIRWLTFAGCRCIGDGVEDHFIGSHHHHLEVVTGHQSVLHLVRIPLTLHDDEGYIDRRQRSCRVDDNGAVPVIGHVQKDRRCAAAVHEHPRRARDEREAQCLPHLPRIGF